MVGEYAVQTQLGEGGMGIVHLARHRDGRRVALKVLRPHIVGDDEARRRLAREVDALSRVRSPWVAEILDADPWAATPYVVTRYVPGLSLHDHAQEEGPLAGADLLWLAGCLAEGIAAVHRAGVLHRDVKPANVLMEGRTPVLIDFGLARVAEDPRLTQTGWLLGTPGYLAPEILYGETPTPAADVHAWAATVAFAATGRNPYGRGPSMAVMDRTRRGEHDLSPMSGPLAEVVEACLAPDPLDRPILPELLAWLRPLSTRPDDPQVPPPVGDEVDDDFTLPLALASAGNPEPAPPTAPPTDMDPATVPEPYPAADHTRMLPPEAPAAAEDSPAADAVARWEQEWDQQVAAGPPVGFLERLRRGALVVLGGVVIGAAASAAPVITGVSVIVLVWLLRSASLTAVAARQRRTAVGRHWYDVPRAVTTTPWHLLRGTVGTMALTLWAAALGLAAALAGYALGLAVPVLLFVAGAVAGVSLWAGPGAGHFRGAVGRVLHPVARGGLAWCIGCVVLLLAAAVLGVLQGLQGTVWLPFDRAPF